MPLPCTKLNPNSRSGGNKHRILVADEIFIEWGREADWLRKRHQQTAYFNKGTLLRPAESNLQWHRTQVFNTLN